MGFSPCVKRGARAEARATGYDRKAVSKANKATLKSEMHISSVPSQTPSSVSGSGDNDGDEY